jgi:hypothetical protein
MSFFRPPESKEPVSSRILPLPRNKYRTRIRKIEKSEATVNHNKFVLIKPLDDHLSWVRAERILKKVQVNAPAEPTCSVILPLLLLHLHHHNNNNNKYNAKF